MSDTLEELQYKYDYAVARRARWVRRYDESTDGSDRKKRALEALDYWGRRITRLEELMAQEVEGRV